MSEKKIFEILKKEGALRPGEIADKTGLDKKVVSEAIKNLKSTGTIHSPKRCFYAVK